MDRRPRQLELLLGGAHGEPERDCRAPPRERSFRVIEGGGEKREAKLRSRDDLARVLVGAAGDMLLKRISSVRAEEIQRRVERLLTLFDRVERAPSLEPSLRRDLDALEALLRETKPRRR